MSNEWPPSEMIYQNKEGFDAKVQAIKEAGIDSLHVVADFDMTLTDGDGKCSTTWGAPKLNQEYEKDREELRAHYRPIEFDPHIAIDEKSKAMDEWWRAHLALIIKHGLSKDLVETRIREGVIEMREGLDELMALLHRNNVPMLVFSAGLGDFIKEFFKVKEIGYPTVHIESNFFEFDENGLAVGFKDQIVHSCNKSEVQLEHKPYKKEVTSRRNVLLLGDSPDDPGMVRGFEHDNVISIGFLNENYDKSEEYKKVYDALLPKGSDMKFVNKLLVELGLSK